MRDGEIRNTLEDRVDHAEKQLASNTAALDELGRMTPDLLVYAEQQPGACWAKVNTIVRNQRGNTCETYEWELAPASRKCVDECDEQARYQEAVASGQAKCEELCAEKECSRGLFSPPDKCETARCFKKFSQCRAAWPHFDSCYLVHLQRPWNCMCIEL